MLTTTDLCRIFNVHRRTIYRWVKAGRIKPIRAGGRKQTTDSMLSQLSALSTRRDDEGNHQIVELITKEDICRMVDVNPRTVQRWVASGELTLH